MNRPSARGPHWLSMIAGAHGRGRLAAAHRRALRRRAHHPAGACPAWSASLVRQFPVTAADDPARYAAELAAVHQAWDPIAPLGLPRGLAARRRLRPAGPLQRLLDALVPAAHGGPDHQHRLLHAGPHAAPLAERAATSRSSSQQASSIRPRAAGGHRAGGPRGRRCRRTPASPAATTMGPSARCRMPSVPATSDASGSPRPGAPPSSTATATSIRSWPRCSRTPASSSSSWPGR